MFKLKTKFNNKEKKVKKIIPINIISAVLSLLSLNSNLFDAKPYAKMQ